MATQGISGTSIFIVLVGSVLAYSGLKGKGVGTTVKAFLAGQAPGGQPDSGLAIMDSGTVTAPPGNVVGLPSGGSAATNKALGRMLAAPYGWSTGPEWAALETLWDHESNWSNTAENPSGAYGIPQALPASKLPAAGQKPISSAAAQISWGLTYIKQRYGTPSAAWAFWQKGSWY